MSTTTINNCDFCKKEEPTRYSLWSIDFKDSINARAIGSRLTSGSFQVDICRPCLGGIAEGSGASADAFKAMVWDALNKNRRE